MKQFSLIACLIMILAGVAPVQAQEGGGVPGFLKRFFVGYTFVNEQADFTTVFPVENRNPLRIDNAYRDTTIITELKKKSAFGIIFGTSIPLGSLGKSGVLALAVEGMYQSITWDYVPPNMSNVILSPTQQAAMAEEFKSTAMGLPLGIDAKFGGDAMADKSWRMSYTFGLGCIPMQSTTTYLKETDSRFGMRPYLKAEVGMFAGVCLKLRASYVFGNYTYMNVDNSTTDSYGNYLANTVLLTGRSSLNLSLILMPFSGAWEKARWWY